MKNISMDWVIRIHGMLYKQTSDTIKQGDLVLDLGDVTYGYCDMIHNGHIAIRHKFVVEVGVPIKRCRKLIMIATNEQLN